MFLLSSYNPLQRVWRTHLSKFISVLKSNLKCICSCCSFFHLVFLKLEFPFGQGHTPILTPQNLSALHNTNLCASVLIPRSIWFGFRLKPARSRIFKIFHVQKYTHQFWYANMLHAGAIYFDIHDFYWNFLNLILFFEKLEDIYKYCMQSSAVHCPGIACNYQEVSRQFGSSLTLFHKKSAFSPNYLHVLQFSGFPFPKIFHFSRFPQPYSAEAALEALGWCSSGSTTGCTSPAPGTRPGLRQSPHAPEFR